MLTTVVWNLYSFCAVVSLFTAILQQILYLLVSAVIDLQYRLSYEFKFMLYLLLLYQVRYLMRQNYTSF